MGRQTHTIVTERRSRATLHLVDPRDVSPSPLANADAFDVEAFSRRVAEAEQAVRSRVPEIHPFDLRTILHSMLMPIERRVFFLKRRRDGGWGF